MCEFEINLKEILNNFNRVKKSLKSNVKICAVVKANAYGFGARKICQLLNHKADYFAVARLSEFLKIVDITTKPILILSPLSEIELKIAVEKGAEISVSNVETLKKIEKIASTKGKMAKVHIVLDTGMNRFGLKTERELKTFLCVLKKARNVVVVGAYSHLFDAENQILTDLQREKFVKFKNTIEKTQKNIIFHLASSVGLKNLKNQFNMVRLGIYLYQSEKNLHRFKSKIVEIKDVKKGEFVSYGGVFVAKNDMKIAVCSAGYADGFSRSLSNRGKVLICQQKVEVVGRVCMDVFMCDISSVKNVKVGDEVVMFGCQGENCISVCEIAKECDTISYEIYTRISERVKRVYKWR